MEDYQKTIVAMDLSKMDQSLLSFVHYMSDKMDIKKLYLLHIIPDLLMPKNADLQFHQLFAPGYPLDERIKDEIRKNADPIFGDNGVQMEIDVVEGKPYRQLLHWAEMKQANMVVVGRKKESERSGITGKRIARYINSHVMFVPENPPTAVKEIMVPVDFSENSASAMLRAFEISQKIEGAKVTCVHVIMRIPSTYYIDIKMESGVDEILKENAKEAWNDFLKEYGFSEEGFNLDIIDNNFESTSARLQDYIKEHKMDLVVMGAQGHSPFENFLYGSTTEKLVDSSKDTPVLVVR